MLAAVLVLALIDATPASPSPSPPPIEILRRALDRVRSYGAPPYVVYTARDIFGPIRIAFRASDELLNIAREPFERGTLPRGDVEPAFVGPLSRSLHEAAGRQSAPGEQASAEATPAPNDIAGTLDTIVTVSAVARPVYRVRVAGIEKERGHTVYRIDATPIADPRRYALRSLYVDSDTYDVWKCTYVSTIAQAATFDVTVLFKPVGPYWIAAEWHARDEQFQYGQKPFEMGLIVGNMAFPPSIPDWYFDQQAYNDRWESHESDPLAALL